jgi:TPP-dependent pyruvate/acetoin dehydrogenase alpha subunit
LLSQGRYRDLNIHGVPAPLLLRLHRFMLRLRLLEETIATRYHPADQMACPVHLCIGQEAGAAALSEVLTVQDYLFSHHRGHGYYLAKGASLDALVAELHGKASGTNSGMAGSQDISMDEARFFGGAILAGSIGIAVGTALALKLKGSPAIVVAGFGEGATDEGIFWEAVNYAALKKLPILFFCENNGYATYSPQLSRQPADNLSEKVAAFGVPARDLFGNDAVAVHEAVAATVTAMRKNAGPSFLQAYTYRWSSHVGPEDDGYVQYRPDDEKELWKQNCPIALLEEKLLAGGVLDSATKEATLAELQAEIDRAFVLAQDGPFPPVRDWRELNESSVSPLADKLLEEENRQDFDGEQRETLPGPY